jgi:putative Holliday junction resolvase
VPKQNQSNLNPQKWPSPEKQIAFFIWLFLSIFAPQMARILSIDYGRKRVGLAVTDPEKIIANRLTTIPTHTIWDFLNEYFRNEKVETVVVGYPKQMNNEASEAVRYINPFLKKFQIQYPEMKLEIIDERFTSKMAFQTMIDGGLKKQKRQDKELIDGISATIILQSYLEQKRNKQS